MGHLVLLGGVAVYLGAAMWVRVDARRRGRSGARWAAFTLLVWPIGLLAWLIRRRRYPVAAAS